MSHTPVILKDEDASRTVTISYHVSTSLSLNKNERWAKRKADRKTNAMRFITQHVRIVTHVHKFASTFCKERRSLVTGAYRHERE